MCIRACGNIEKQGKQQMMQQLEQSKTGQHQAGWIRKVAAGSEQAAEH